MRTKGPAGFPGSVAAPSIAVLIILAIGFRLTALFLLRYGSSVPDWSDFRYYHDLASLSAQGYFPDVQFWMEYPPLFPWLAVGAYQLSLLIPSWIHPYFWFDLFLTVALAAADAGTIILIDRLGDAFWGKPAGRRSATIYAAMFLPAFAVLGWFDTLPTFFLLLSLEVLVCSPAPFQKRPFARAALSGVAAGVGIMFKLFPLLALPTAAIPEVRPESWEPGDTAPRPRVPTSLLSGATAAVTACATVLLIAAPFLAISPATFLSTFRNVLARGSWMSPWAILDGYYESGGVASLHDRLFYNASALWGQPDRVPALWFTLVAIGLGVYVWRWWVARRVGTARAAIAFTGFGVCLLLLLSRGFSQQFTVWLLPFVALLLPGVDGALLAVCLILNDIVLEGYVYVTLFPTLHHLLWISATVRTVLFLWFALEAAVAIDPKTDARFRVMRRRVLLPASGLAVIALAAALVVVAPTVQAAMLTRDGAAPAVAAIENLDPSTALVFTQSDAFDGLEGYLRPRTSLLVAEPGLLTWTGDRSLYHRLETGLAGRTAVVLVTDATQPTTPLLPAVRTWLGARFGAATTVKAGSLVLEEFSQSRLPPERSLGVLFGDAITLVGVRPRDLTGKPGAPLVVTLDWNAATLVPRDYTVSLQLLDGPGRLVAQHDSMPANNALPTSTWRPGEAVADAIELPLPATLAPGNYQLIVILYDHQTLQRLSVQGTGQSGDHAIVGTVRIE